MLVFVPVPAALGGVASLADAAFERFLRGVTELVFLQRVAPAELFLAVHALEHLAGFVRRCAFDSGGRGAWRRSPVQAVHVLLVSLEAAFGGVAVVTQLAFVGFPHDVGFLVVSETLTAGESFVTNGTFQRVEVSLFVFSQTLTAL